MLETGPTVRVRTGFDALDRTLGGLYWGESVVWELDGASAAPFYRTMARVDGTFDAKHWVAFTGGAIPLEADGAVHVVDARFGGPLTQPADLVRLLRRRCDPRRRSLVLFESLEGMARSWGFDAARSFFARCCRMLLDIGAIAYWSLDVHGVPPAVRETAEAVTPCVLRVDQRSMCVVKAEGHEPGAEGSLLHWHANGAPPQLEPTGQPGRIAASLRGIRRSRGITQHELARLGGVSASAISQAERVERGLSLATLTRLGSALGMTIDELVRGEDATLYRLGRRREDPHHGARRATTLLGDLRSGVHVDLVHLRPRDVGVPARQPRGQGIVAVAGGLVQVHAGGQTPTLRHGEVLLADCGRVERWRNVGETDATLFWIVIPGA